MTIFVLISTLFSNIYNHFTPMHSDQTVLPHEPFLDNSDDESNQRYQIQKPMPITAGICLLVCLLLLPLSLILKITIKRQPSTVTITNFTNSSENIRITLDTNPSNEFRGTSKYLCI